jgi:hypothetical protein
MKKKQQNSCEKRYDVLDLQPQNKTRSLSLERCQSGNGADC